MTKFTKFDKFMVLLILFSQILTDFGDMIGHMQAHEYAIVLLFAVGLGYESWLLGMLYKFMHVPTYQKKGIEK